MALQGGFLLVSPGSFMWSCSSDSSTGAGSSDGPTSGSWCQLLGGWSVLICSEDVQFYFMDTHSAPSGLKTVFQESRTLKVPVAHTQNAHNVTSAPFLLIQVCYKAIPRSGEPDSLDGRSRGAILQMHVHAEMGGILVISFANNPLQTELTFLRPC